MRINVNPEQSLNEAKVEFGTVEGDAINAGDRATYLNKKVYICEYSKDNRVSNGPDELCLEQFDHEFYLRKHVIEVHGLEVQQLELEFELSTGRLAIGDSWKMPEGVLEEVPQGELKGEPQGKA